MSLRVLIVEDDEALSDNLAEIVQGLGAETVLARDGKSARARAAETDFEVALVDVGLPDGDGITLLEPLRRRAPFTQIVLVTGNATLEGAMSAVRGGAFAYVLKPFSPPDLLETVRRAGDRATLLREGERLRHELQLSEARHRELVESVPALVIALDADGRITTWNRQLEQITGLPRGKMLGTSGVAFVGQGERPRELPIPGAPPRLVRWRRAEVQGPNGAPITYAVGIDVTDEQEMRRRTSRAERLAAVGTMAAGLAHEVRNPLNSASLQLTLLERKLERNVGAGPETTIPIARIIKSEIDRLDRLVRDFLSFAQPRPIEHTPVDLGALLESFATQIAPEAAKAGRALRCHVAPDLPPVGGDGERLRQVLLNLTRNALEAMLESGSTLTLRARATPDDVEIDVEDDGPGFADDLPVFDAFFTTKEQGTGLGLALVHRIITDHGGTIRVASRPGRTCFTLTLPRA
jgi:signal transduction histidine kinase